jgi:pullulanase/glycogen debranching enzyme
MWCDVVCWGSAGGIAYANEPAETVNYVSAHDNETLFDLCVLKMPAGLRSTEERIRASWLCTSLVALAHGIPFFHAGSFPFYLLSPPLCLLASLLS